MSGQVLHEQPDPNWPLLPEAKPGDSKSQQRHLAWRYMLWILKTCLKKVDQLRDQGALHEQYGDNLNYELVVERMFDKNQRIFQNTKYFKETVQVLTDLGRANHQFAVLNYRQQLYEDKILPIHDAIDELLMDIDQDEKEKLARLAVLACQLAKMVRTKVPTTCTKQQRKKKSELFDRRVHKLQKNAKLDDVHWYELWNFVVFNCSELQSNFWKSFCAVAKKQLTKIKVRNAVVDDDGVLRRVTCVQQVLVLAFEIGSEAPFDVETQAHKLMSRQWVISMIKKLNKSKKETKKIIEQNEEKKRDLTDYKIVLAVVNNKDHFWEEIKKVASDYKESQATPPSAQVERSLKRDGLRKNDKVKSTGVKEAMLDNEKRVLETFISDEFGSDAKNAESVQREVRSMTDTFPMALTRPETAGNNPRYDSEGDEGDSCGEDGGDLPEDGEFGSWQCGVVSYGPRGGIVRGNMVDVRNNCLPEDRAALEVMFASRGRGLHDPGDGGVVSTEDPYASMDSAPTTEVSSSDGEDSKPHKRVERYNPGSYQGVKPKKRRKK